MKKNIGESIRKFRIEKDYSQQHMALELGMSVSNYSKIERNEIDLTINKVEKIANVLNVSLTKILNIEDVNNVTAQTNNGLQSINTNNPIINHYNKEVVDKLIHHQEIETVFLKSQIKEKDDLIATLIKKVK